LSPDGFPDAYFYGCYANFMLGNMAAAEKSAREVLRLNLEQRFPQVENVLGLILAQRGSFQEAREHLSNYLALSPRADNAEVTRNQIAQLEQALASTASR